MAASTCEGWTFPEEQAAPEGVFGPDEGLGSKRLPLRETDCVAVLRGLELGNVGFLQSRLNSLVSRKIFVPEAFSRPPLQCPYTCLESGRGQSAATSRPFV